MKSGLKSIFTGQKSLFAEKDRYSDAIGEIGFAPERGNRYAYTLIAAALTDATAENRATNIAIPGAAVNGVSVDQARFPTQAKYPLAASTMGTASWLPTVTGMSVPTSAIGGIVGTCPLCSFSASGTGNIDNETAGLDFQTVTSEFVSITLTGCSDLQDKLAPGAAGSMKNDVACD